MGTDMSSLPETRRHGGSCYAHDCYMILFFSPALQGKELSLRVRTKKLGGTRERRNSAKRLCCFQWGLVLKH
jgi:hypothetical protein